MANLTLRIPKGTPVTNAELDDNFTNLNRDNLLSTKNSIPWVASTSVLLGQIVNTADRFYLVTTGGTTGAVAPSHISGTIASGTAQLQYTTLGNYDPRDIITKLLIVDGTGSGLDADLVDGLNTSSILPVAADKSSVVTRDSSGNFVANVVTANLTGTASNAALLDNLDTSSSLPAIPDKSSVVTRDSSGNFSANTVTANLTGTASNSTTINNLTVSQLLQQAADNALSLSIALG